MKQELKDYFKIGGFYLLIVIFIFVLCSNNEKVNESLEEKANVIILKY